MSRFANTTAPRARIRRAAHASEFHRHRGVRGKSLMAERASYEQPIGGLIAGIALLNATAASAQSYTNLLEQASAAHRQADYEAQDEMYQSSCEDYNRALDLYADAIGSLARMPIWSKVDHDYVSSQGSMLEGAASRVMDGAKAVCGRPTLPNYRYQKLEAQRIVTLLESQAKDAVRQYEAGDFAGACASSRLAAEGFGQVARDMKASPEIEAAFTNSAQLYENAKQAVADRDEFYCKK